MEQPVRLNPIVKVILEGVYDPGSPFSKLHGVPHVLLMIWKNVTSYWKSCIKPSKTYRGKYEDELEDIEPKDLFGDQAFREWDTEIFPEPTGIYINMMPFIMSPKFSDCCLPDYVRPYAKIIEKCMEQTASEYGKVGFLTIHESDVEANTSQRRPGIHTESPGVVKFRNDFDQEVQSLDVLSGNGSSTELPTYLTWGRGFGYGDSSVYEGGIYMGSTEPDSCAIWDCQIIRDDSEPEVVGPLGDVEHLREFLPGYHVMEENAIYWLTDRTPHESLPLKEATYRQYFRLVTSDVSLWYEDHSTPNPLGVVPDPKITKIVRGSKFDKDGVVVVVDKN